MLVQNKTLVQPNNCCPCGLYCASICDLNLRVFAKFSERDMSYNFKSYILDGYVGNFTCKYSDRFVFVFVDRPTTFLSVYLVISISFKYWWSLNGART